LECARGFGAAGARPMGGLIIRISARYTVSARSGLGMQKEVSIFQPMSRSQGWLASLSSHRELVRLLVARDLKVRYKRSVLGFFWTLLNPLITMIIFSVVFSRIFAAFYEQYKLYMISGVLFWSFFSLATSQGLLSMINNGTIIRRIAVPKVVFPVSSVCSNFVNLVFSLLALAIFIPFVGGHFNLSLLWLLLTLPLLFAFTLGVALLLSTVTVFFRDIRSIWDPLLLIWFFLTPVFYPRSVVPEKYSSLFRLNPMLVILEVCRIPIHQGVTPPLGLFLKAGLAAACSLSIGLWAFKRYQDQFIYHV
jgi:ABC-2 type transport system permease protein